MHSFCEPWAALILAVRHQVMCIQHASWSRHFVTCIHFRPFGCSLQVDRLQVDIGTAAWNLEAVASVVADAKEELRNTVPPVAHEPTTKGVGVGSSLGGVASPLKASLVDEEAGDVVVGTRSTSLDANRLPGSVEVDVLLHHQAPWEGVVLVEELVVVLGAVNGGDVGVAEVAADTVFGLSGEDWVAEAGADVVRLT